MHKYFLWPALKWGTQQSAPFQKLSTQTTVIPTASNVSSSMPVSNRTWWSATERMTWLKLDFRSALIKIILDFSQDLQSTMREAIWKSCKKRLALRHQKSTSCSVQHTTRLSTTPERTIPWPSILPQCLRRYEKQQLGCAPDWCPWRYTIPFRQLFCNIYWQSGYFIEKHHPRSPSRIHRPSQLLCDIQEMTHRNRLF